MIYQNKLAEVLAEAAANGAPKPCIRTGGLYFKLAKASSVNPGFVYVTKDYDYLGKISPEGRFLGSASLSAEDKTTILSTTNAPFYASTKHGQDTGECSCCGRTLTNELSVKLGIGPICRGYYFPSHTKGDVSKDLLADLGSCATPLIDSMNEEKLEVDDIVEAFTRLDTYSKIQVMSKLTVSMIMHEA
jgi:hypothetical protein